MRRDHSEVVGKDLLDRVKTAMTFNWRRQAQARALVKITIEDVLEDGLPRAYDKPLYEQKCSALFEHVFESAAGA